MGITHMGPGHLWVLPMRVQVKASDVQLPKGLGPGNLWVDPHSALVEVESTDEEGSVEDVELGGSEEDVDWTATSFCPAIPLKAALWLTTSRSEFIVSRSDPLVRSL